MTRSTGWLPVLLIIPAITLLHLYVAPYTKVEESFNVQAVHDILTYGVPWSNVSERFLTQYDHMTFPGAVPRTFVGALVLAAFSKPILWMKDALDGQFLVRAVLGGLNAISLSYYAINARKALGESTAVWYILFQASHFHIVYYSSRPLPNMFAFPLTTTALALLLPRAVPVQESLNRLHLAVFLLTLTAIIFRSEIAVLLCTHIAYIVLKQISRHGHLLHGVALLRSVVVPAGILGSLVGLCITVPNDTFFWQSPTYIWPEFSAFLSNVFPSDDSLGASAWGTQPWHWYFSIALPRLLMSPFIYLALWVLDLFYSAISGPACDLLLPNLAYIAVYSILPHKETRFIFPVVPPLTLAAALSASYIWTRRHRTILYHLLAILIVVSTILSALLAHLVLLPISALSYPGAHALKALHEHAATVHIPRTTNNAVLVHLDNLSTQTGITRFLQHPPSSNYRDPHWIYDKSDNATDLLNPFWWTQFDYAIMESPQLAIGSWDVVSTVHGLGSIRILSPHQRTEKQSIEDGGSKRLDVSNYGLDSVAGERYGDAGRAASVLARQLLRDGYGVRWMLGEKWSWTRGWWIDVDWVHKLYVLKQRESLARDELEAVASSDTKA